MCGDNVVWGYHSAIVASDWASFRQRIQLTLSALGSGFFRIYFDLGLYLDLGLGPLRRYIKRGLNSFPSFQLKHKHSLSFNTGNAMPGGLK